MKFELWQAFVVGTIISWGMYIPILHDGQSKLGGGAPSTGALRAFICVGLAYLITAVVIPIILMFSNMSGGEPLDYTHDGKFNTGGFGFALFGGILGAAGALCIILAIKNGGKPLYVAPLVFAGAPVINSIISLLWHPPADVSDPKMLPGWIMFGAGILLAAAGAGLVLYSKGYIDQKAREAAKAKQAAIVAQAAPPATGQH